MAIEFVGRDKIKRATNWRFRCSCGRDHVTDAGSVRSGGTKSCGCLLRELAKTKKITHGMSRTKVYEVWASMLERCRNPQSGAFRHYGGRGIKVCDRWGKFENFLSDMGQPPAKHSIDRVDNDGDYEPGNCQWATKGQQNRNRRKVRAIENFTDIELQAELNRRTASGK